MRSIHRAFSQKGEAGDVLPTAFPALEAEGIHFRRGQMVLVAAAPGRGKSLFALNLAARLAALKNQTVRSLYFSADSDAHTQGLRAAALLSGHQMADIEFTVTEDLPGAEHYGALLESLRENLRFVFSPAPTCDDINDELAAYTAMYGEWPQLIVIDNLSNVYASDDEWSNLRLVLDFLHELARDTGSAVIVLHHLDGSYDNGQDAPPLSALRGKVSKTPEVCLTLYGGTEGKLGVCVVKNRNGKADPTGNFRINLHADYARARVS